MPDDGPHLSDSGNSDVRGASGRVRRVLRRALVAWGLFCALFVLCVVSPLTDLIFQQMDAQDDLARADYIICLGGTPERVPEAVRLLKDGYAPTLIVTNRGIAAKQMYDHAIDLGATRDQVLLDSTSSRTEDHPEAVAKLAGISVADDTCIIVSSYTHLARSRAVFEKAGYRHLIMREPRWERISRGTNGFSWKGRILVAPQLLYEGAAWALYWIRGDV